MNHKSTRLILLLLVISGLSACNPDTDIPLPDRPPALGKGIYIVNYGLSQGEGAGLDFFSIDSNRMHRNVFELRNNTSAGKGLVEMVLWKQYAFFTAEKSSFLWAINASTALVAGKYSRLNDPRRLLVIDAEKTYVSSASQKGIHVMHTSTLQYLGTIALPAKVEHFTQTTGRVFASVAGQGAPGKVYVVDHVLDNVTDSLSVPGAVAALANAPDGTLWVLCGGSETSQCMLLAYNPQNLQLKKQLPLPVYDMSGAGLAFVQQNRIAILAGKVYLLDPDDANPAPQTFINPAGRRFTSINYHAASGNYYLTAYQTGTAGGQLFRYNQNGTIIDSIATGIQPISTVFN